MTMASVRFTPPPPQLLHLPPLLSAGDTVRQLLAQGVRPPPVLCAQASCEGQRFAPAARPASAGQTQHAA